MKVKKNWVRVIFRRRVFVMAALLVQIIFILILAGGSSLFFRYASRILRLLSLVVSLYIFNKDEKSAYKLTWIFLILMFPLFGGVLYVTLHSQFNSGRMKRLIENIRRAWRKFYALPGNVLPALREELPEYFLQARYLQDYVGFPVYEHTQTEYFPSGEAFFKQVVEELKKAERYVFLEFFILREGLMFNTILDILEKKAAAGLDVRIIYDDLGCFMSLPRNFRQILEARGIRSMVFNPFTPILSSLQNNRDHRKIITIDGKTAFTGGINLADEYINAYERFGHWKDCGIMLKGEAAWGLTLIFLEMWNLEQTGPQAAKDDCMRFYPWKDEKCGIPSEGYAQPYADSPMDDENVGEQVYLQIINNAREYVYINTPYLVVDENLLSALSLAAKSGVDVRIITPHRWDKKIVQITSQSYYRRLLNAGVKVYEYSKGFNHCKTFVCDDKIATVGTMNLDFRSLYLHFECGVALFNTPTVHAIKEDFLATIPISRQICLQDCARNTLARIVQDILRLFAPLM
ncbi:MAG: cardiolipin synthase [Treponema sp.]|jgi:cardiolipin synthase|nr:cardiolipin synthase [Treponema sp.]